MSNKVNCYQEAQPQILSEQANELGNEISIVRLGSGNKFEDQLGMSCTMGAKEVQLTGKTAK